MKNEELVLAIENDLHKNRLKLLSRLPIDLFNQLKRIEDKIFELWNLDSVYRYSVMQEVFNTCVHSKLTLDQCEDIVFNHNISLLKYTHSEALKKMAKQANNIGRRNLLKRIFT